MDRISKLTADLLAGRISCQAYADAVTAAQSGATPLAERDLTNPVARAYREAFDRDCAARGMISEDQIRIA